VCVTGLVVVDTGTHWTVFGKTIILILIQVGGLGFMTMATLISFLVGKRISLRSRLIMQEALGEFSISGVVRLTRYIIMVTFAIEGVGAFFLSTRFVPEYGRAKGIFYSIFHSVSAFCNAGFDLIGDGKSLTGYVGDPVVNFIIMFLIIIGGIGFTVIIDMLRARKFKKLSLNSKIVLSMTGLLLATGFVLIFVFEFFNPNTLGLLPFGQKILAAMFHSVTTRTAGFNSLPMEDLTLSSKFLTMVFMFIGGSPGSTAGGIKTTTVALVILTMISVTRGREDTEAFNRRINRDAVNRSLAMLGIAALILIVVIMLLTLTESSQPFEDIIFEAVSAFGTVGLSVGLTTKLSLLGKLLVIVTMFVGRLGPLTIIFALARKQAKRKTLIRYPEGKVMIG
jgi:trk system potassium uptake protein TrkH